MESTLAVVASGFYGLYAYVTYPRQLAANRGGITREAMIAEVAELDRECLTLSDQVGKDAHQVVLHSIEATVLGGTVWEQLFADPARRAGVVAPSHGLEEIRRRIASRFLPTPLGWLRPTANPDWLLQLATAPT